MKLTNDLRVLVVSSSFPIKKEEVTYSFILNEVYGLQKRGVQTYVATCLYGEDVDLDGIHVHFVPKKMFDLPFYMSRLYGMPGKLVFPESVLLWPLSSYCVSKYRDEIIKEAIRHRVDLVHAHFAFPEGYAAMLAKRVTKKPLIISLRGYDILKEPSLNYGSRLNKHLDNFIREAIASADRVIVASTSVADEALRADVSKEKLVIIPNGVDIDKFNRNLDGTIVRRELGIGNNPFILSVGGLISRKGIEYLLQAARDVIVAYPDAMFVIVGEGPQRRYLEQLSERLRVSRNVVFVGVVSRSRIPFFFAACDVFVHPALMEGFGNVVIEAMACGKPVIATRVGGAADALKDDVNGYLVEPKNPYEIADRIVRLLGDDGKREKMGREARKIVEEKYSMSLRVSRTIEVYRSLLDYN